MLRVSEPKLDGRAMSDSFEVLFGDLEFRYAPSFPEDIPILCVWASETLQLSTWFDSIDGGEDTGSTRSEHLQVRFRVRVRVRVA